MTGLAPFLLLLTSASPADRPLAAVAEEAREVIAVVDWFYIRHRACPQPSRPEELAEMQSDLGDGFEIEPHGPFTEIAGISMAEHWRYYTSPEHPDRCTLWRRVGRDPALIWRRHRDGESWAYDPGDGAPERPFKNGGGKAAP